MDGLVVVISVLMFLVLNWLLYRLLIARVERDWDQLVNRMNALAAQINGGAGNGDKETLAKLSQRLNDMRSTLGDNYSALTNMTEQLKQRAAAIESKLNSMGKADGVDVSCDQLLERFSALQATVSDAYAEISRTNDRMARAEKSVDAVQGSTKQAHSDVRGIQERVDTLSANFAKTSYSVTKLDQDVGTLGRRVNDASTSLQHVSAMVDDFNVERVLVAVDFAKFVAKSTLPKGPSELVDLLVALGFDRLYDSLALKNVVFADGPYKSGSFTVDRAVGYCLAVEDTNVVLLAFIHRRNLLYKAEKRDGLIGDPHTVLTVIGVVQDGTVVQTISLLVGPLNGLPVIANVDLQQQLKAVVRGLLFDQPSYNNLLLCIEPNTYLQRTELIKQFVANETLATQPRVHNTDQFWMFTDLGDRSSFESYELRAYQNANLPVSAESGLLFAAVVSETVQFKDYRKIMNWA